VGLGILALVVHLDVAVEVPAAQPGEEPPQDIRSPFEGIHKFPPREIQTRSTSVTR
jgi:hypothetical protein